MCNYFSAIVLRNGSVKWCESDSHEDIIDRLGLIDNDSSPGRKFVRIEVEDFDLRKFQVDEQSSLPGWWDDRVADVRAWLGEHKDDIIKGRKAYDEAMASVGKAYNEALATASKAYSEAVASADKAYEEAVASASKAYAEAVAPARKALESLPGYTPRKQ